jgi:hypothetical protein
MALLENQMTIVNNGVNAIRDSKSVLILDTIRRPGCTCITARALAVRTGICERTVSDRLGKLRRGGHLVNRMRSGQRPEWQVTRRGQIALRDVTTGKPQVVDLTSAIFAEVENGSAPQCVKTHWVPSGGLTRLGVATEKLPAAVAETVDPELEISHLRQLNGAHRTHISRLETENAGLRKALDAAQARLADERGARAEVAQERARNAAPDPLTLVPDTPLASLAAPVPAQRRKRSEPHECGQWAVVCGRCGKKSDHLDYATVAGWMRESRRDIRDLQSLLADDSREKLRMQARLDRQDAELGQLRQIVEAHHLLPRRGIAVPRRPEWTFADLAVLAAES